MKFSKILGFTGALAWVSTEFLRNTSAMNNEILSFILGILPNIGAAIAICLILEIIFVERLKKKQSMKLLVYIIGGVFLGALVSELVHELFLNSRFDINDIIATIVSLGIYSFTRVREIKKDNRKVLVDRN
ncbi:MAG: hypothetical protein ACRCTZ_21265 [Sarcina sp.]